MTIETLSGPAILETAEKCYKDRRGAQILRASLL
jgi:hypothetical protein